MVEVALPEFLTGGLCDKCRECSVLAEQAATVTLIQQKRQNGKSTFAAILELWDSLLLTLKVNSQMINHRKNSFLYLSVLGTIIQ